MPLVPGSPEQDVKAAAPGRFHLSSVVLHLPRNVYILLCFTLGKGFQLTIPSGSPLLNCRKTLQSC